MISDWLTVHSPKCLTVAYGNFDTPLLTIWGYPPVFQTVRRGFCRKRLV